MTPERLAAYRKTFGPMSTEELRAIVEGRKPHKLSEETLEAIRLLLAERKGGGNQAWALLQPRAMEERDKNSAPPTDTPDTRRDPVTGGKISTVNQPRVKFLLVSSVVLGLGVILFGIGLAKVLTNLPVDDPRDVKPPNVNNLTVVEAHVENWNREKVRRYYTPVLMLGFFMISFGGHGIAGLRRFSRNGVSS